METSMNLSHAIRPFVGAAIHGLAQLLLLAAVPAVAASQSANTNFDVSKHGFSFGNTWTNVCVNVTGGGTQLRYDPNGASCNTNLSDGGPWGLCGGMSLIAGERFVSDQTSSTLTQSVAKKDIVNGQMRTLDAAIVGEWLKWIAAPD